MEKIEGQKAEIGSPGLGQKPKAENQEKQEKPADKKEQPKKQTLRFMTRSRHGNKVRVIGPNDPPNRHERRRRDATMLRKPRVNKGPKSQRANTPGAFGRQGRV